MRIALLYPPPWKIPAPGELIGPARGGPPPGLNAAACLTGDIQNIPGGLLSLAAQSRKAGHDVTVLNLFAFAWDDVVRIVRELRADLFGISCFTSNRRGALSLARLIRRTHPGAHIAAGGPHATALPVEMLDFCDAIDTVVMGEGEETFGELVGRLERGSPAQGIPGTAWRRDGAAVAGPRRARITDLDSLASPFDLFDDYILITSRGCPWDCTFCASTALWGREYRRHSPRRVLDMLERITGVNGQKAVAVKDETFTCNREHVLQICRGIEKRGISFVWSCDTRADALDEELLAAMRAAGCQRISIGVESGSPAVLRSLRKDIDLQTVREATAMARIFGFQVRFYMIVGSRAETPETLQQTIDFVASVRPNQVIFNPFTLIPGTPEWELAETAGQVRREAFFTDTFFELHPMLTGDETPGGAAVAAWLADHAGLQEVWDYSVPERTEVLRRLPGLPAARLDLGGACYGEGRLTEAAGHVREALGAGYPLPGLCYNYLACIAARQGSLQEALSNLIRAREQGYHDVVEQNLAIARQWVRDGGPRSSAGLQLRAGHGFEVTRPRRQPVTPGPVDLPGGAVRPVRF